MFYPWNIWCKPTKTVGIEKRESVVEREGITVSALRKINTSFGGKFVSTKYRTLAKSYTNWVAYEEDDDLYSKFYFSFSS